jgi:TRAP-type C4-dicarboxylate transport system substrate-binding protein
MQLHATPPAILHTKLKPVKNLEDLKGIKIRTAGNSTRLAQLLGAAPVSVFMPEVYDAINKGVAEGLFAPNDTMMMWNIGEVIKYSTRNPSTGYSSVFYAVMNKSKWATLQPQDQKIIDQINEEWTQRQAKLWDDENTKAAEYIKKHKITVIELSREEDSRWAAKAQPLFDEYVNNMKKLGLPGEEVLKFAREFIKANSK